MYVQKRRKRKKKSRTLTVQAWPDRKPGKLYKGRVTTTEDVGDRLVASIDDLDPTQEGRRHSFKCPLPPRPGNAASRFLLACGLDANTVGTTICIDDDVVGAVVGMRFYPDPADRSAMRIEFEKLAEPQKDASDSAPSGKQSPPQLDSSVLEKEESKWQL